MNPVFKNRENLAHKIKDAQGKEREVWESRSGAVNGIIFGIYSDNVFVLVEKRSKTMRDEPSKWCVPCGYVDWDEDGYEAMIREVFQETGLYLPKFKNYLIFNNDEGDGDVQPFYVRTNPNENRQNLSMFYISIYDFTKGLPKVESYQNEEIEIVKWLPVDEVFKTKYKWAFKHDKFIEKSILKFEKYFV